VISIEATGTGGYLILFTGERTGKSFLLYSSRKKKKGFLTPEAG